MSPRTRRAALTSLALASTLVVGACSIPIPEVSPEPASDDPVPALDTVRVERVMAELGSTVEAGDEAADAAVLEPRLTGAALDTRALQYALAAATADTDAPTTPTTLPTELAALPVVSVSEEWPHTLAVIGQIPDGDNTPVLMALRQDDPRSSYRLTSWVRLLPGVTTPTMALPEVGSAPLAPDAAGLVRTPADTLAAYADLLQNQDDSDARDAFAEDSFRTAVFTDREQILSGVEDGGEYSETVEVRDDEPVTLQTADGGAVVFGALGSTQVYERTVADAELTIATPALVALAGADGPIEVTSTFRAQYRMMVAFYVPPEGSQDAITVLGAERVLADVDAD